MSIKKISSKLNINDLSKKKLLVGFFDGDKYSDGTEVAYVASIHEFGTKNIPARPFMRVAIKNNEKKWKDIFSGLIKKGNSVKQSFEVLGNVAAGDVAQAIKDVSSPALKQSTIKQKGFSKPLVDTGKMLQSVRYEVLDD